RGGWTWYTGAAGWMYRAGVEGILGIRKDGEFLTIAPRIPQAWPGFSATIRIDDTCYRVSVDNRDVSGSTVVRAVLDGVDAPVEDGALRVRIDGAEHALTISLATLPA
ncbi:glycosyl hydrolase family 65 protein, partial [Aurantimonas sp. VKM B-3413]|uniref:glycosyl hydrolase family 65 protein n=1 Tax=Aurantimonas sp. VKM B-3413 TaxID=2779401 RepID=UPI001E2D8422